MKIIKLNIIIKNYKVFYKLISKISYYQVLIIIILDFSLVFQI